MTPEELDSNFYYACYYYACNGDIQLNLPFEFTIGDNGDGPIIVWWGYVSPSEPSYNDLLQIDFESLEIFLFGLEKQAKIERITEQDTFPLWVDIYARLGLDVMNVMNQIL